MPQDDPFDSGVHELGGGDFAGVGARVGGVAVLGCDLGRGAEGVLYLQQVDRGWSDDDLCGWDVSEFEGP